MRKRIAILASGNGTNAQAIINATKSDLLQADIKVIITNNQNANVIQRAKNENIPCKIILIKQFANKKDYEIEILNIMKNFNIELIVLAGYMSLIGDELLIDFPNKIVNIHPSLLPKYKGLNAIQQNIDNADNEFGVTVHYVDRGMDTGEIIDQEKIIIDLNLPKQEIENLIHEIEHKLYVKALNKIIS